MKRTCLTNSIWFEVIIVKVVSFNNKNYKVLNKIAKLQYAKNENNILKKQIP